MVKKDILSKLQLLDELSEYFNVSFQSDDCETIGGLIAQNMGHVPKKVKKVL